MSAIVCAPDGGGDDGIVDVELDPQTITEIAKMRATIEKLPGKENAKRRQALNKRIRKLAGGNGADARDSTNANAKGGRGTRAHPEENQAKEDAATAKPETSLNRRRSRGKRNQKDAASADTDESGTDGAASAPATPQRSLAPTIGKKSPFKTMRGSGEPDRVRVLDEDLVPHEYIKLNRVGKGSFAACYKAIRCETGETVCLKVTDLCVKKIDTVDVRDEMNFLRKLHHPNCLSLQGYSIDINLIVTMVVEFCPYSLEDIRTACDKNESVRTRIEPTLARQCMGQLIAGISYMHTYSKVDVIAHFDIKPDNIMSTIDGILKIADFGLAVALKGKDGVVTDGMYRGTDEYMAPEVSAGKTSFYGLPADIWSIGVTFYELVFGRLCKPDRSSYPRRLDEALQKADFASLEPAHYVVNCGGGDTTTLDEQLILFFDGCFKKVPGERATIDMLVADPLFQYSVEESARAVVAEIEVVATLKKARTRARKEYSKQGALEDLDLESSSDSSEESSSGEDDDDEDGSNDEEDDDKAEGTDDAEGDDAGSNADDDNEEGGDE